MSYILDALKKAETERNLGEIPGIHAQPLHLAAEAPQRAWRHDPWRWLALVCIAFLLGLAAWKWRPTDSEQIRPAVAPVPHSAPTPTPPAAQMTTPAPTSAPAAVAASVPVQDAAAKPSRKIERRTKHADSGTETRPARPKAAVEAPVSDIRDLPLDVQRDVQALTIGGYIYSARPADRSVLINQSLLKEGDQISPGLTLEGIRPDGLVLGYRGKRFSKPY